MSTVEYLAPGAATWTERTTENSEDLIADPFWRIKQASVASKDAILIRCGAGFIKRSTDGGENWSTVTPTTDPPNDAGDSPSPTVGNVTFNQLDGSVSTQDEFVALVTWQNASSAWRTWLYFSDDNFATNGTWAAIGGGSGDDLTSFNTSQKIAGGAPGYYDPDPYWSESFNGSRAIARLSNTKFVVSYQENSSETYVFEAYLHVIDIQSNGTLTIGPKRGYWNYKDNGDVNEVHGQKIFPWDSQHVLILSHEFDYEFDHDGFGDWAFLARLAFISGDNVTFGNAIEIDDDYYVDGDFYPYHWDFDKVPGLNNWGVIAYNTWEFSPSFQGEGLARMIQKTGSLTIAVSPTYYIWAPDENPGSDSFSVTAIDINNAVIFFSTGKDTGSGTFQIHCVHLSIIGYVISPGTYQYLGGQCIAGVRSIMLDTNKFIFVREAAGLFATSVSKSGTTYTVQSNYTIVSDAYVIWRNFSFKKLDSNRFAAFWDSGAAWGVLARIVYMTGTYTMTGGTTITLAEGGGIEESLADGIFASSKFIAMYYKDYNEDAVRAVTAPLPIGYEAKGLGISIGKGLGNKAWVTIWDNADGLSLVDIALPGLAENDRFVLSDATESEMNGKIWIAYPYGIYGSDDAVAIFGRMDSPQGLSSPEHVIYTGNGGASFSSIENGWVGNHCGSIHYLTNGDLYAIRNDGTATRLYIGSLVTALVMISILPLPAGVEPHGMTVDPYNLSLVACSKAAGSLMVAQSSSPYINWDDFTLDHQTAEGVNAVAIL